MTAAVIEAADADRAAAQIKLSREGLMTAAVVETTAVDESRAAVQVKLSQLFDEVFSHDGYGDIRVEMRILRRGQKEVILHCGKQYRYVMNYQGGE